MNGYERIFAALHGHTVDKIPVMLHNFMMAARESGVTMKKFRSSPRVIADSFIKSVEKYQLDGVLVDIDTVTLAGAVGVTVDFPENEPARSHLGYLSNIEDARNLKAVNIENYKYIQIWLESVRFLKEYFNNDIFIRGNCDQAPFSLASMVRGSQDWMTDLMTADENLVTDLLEYCTDITCQFIRLMAQTGADMVSNGDSVSGPEMISPEMYVKFALPYERKVIDTAHALGKPYALHICGNTDSILEQMLSSGADALELDYKTDPFLAYNLMHNKTTFIGNIDPSGVLALGSVEDVELKTQELLGIFSKTNRFILNAGCALPATTPSENIRAMIDVARNLKKANTNLNY
jgi:MtaA/CmuA family methyltransferase